MRKLLITGVVAVMFAVVVAACSSGATTSSPTSTSTTTTTSPTATASPTPSPTPNVPAKLGFITKPVYGIAGEGIYPAPVVAIEDGLGNTVAASTAPVTLSITPETGSQGAVLQGTTTVNAVSGLATFSGLSIDLTGSNYMLTATSPGLAPATSDVLFYVVSATMTTSSPTATPTASASPAPAATVTPSPSTTPPAAATSTSFKWWLIGGIAVVVIALGVAFLLLRSRRKKEPEGPRRRHLRK